MSRKEIRQAVATLLSSNVSDLVATYDHQTKDTAGQSPIAMVHSDGTGYSPLRTHNDLSRQHALIIGLLWKRIEEDATEDYLDDLGDDVRDVLDNNYRNATWKALRVDQEFSQMDYVTVEGQQYRREQIRIVVWE